MLFSRPVNSESDSEPDSNPPKVSPLIVRRFKFLALQNGLKCLLCLKYKHFYDDSLGIIAKLFRMRGDKRIDHRKHLTPANWHFTNMTFTI